MKDKNARPNSAPRPTARSTRLLVLACQRSACAFETSQYETQNSTPAASRIGHPSHAPRCAPERGSTPRAPPPPLAPAVRAAGVHGRQQPHPLGLDLAVQRRVTRGEIAVEHRPFELEERVSGLLLRGPRLLRGIAV